MKLHFSRTATPIKFIASLLMAQGLLFLGCAPIEQGASDEQYSNISSRDQEYLATYGDWVEAVPYGEVWCPRVNSSWEPFYYGQWVWSDQGWVWESYEPYGWLVYHHGNWDYRPEIGWFWIPSEEWSPATVQWTEFGDYIGWAPSPPGGVILPAPFSPEGVHIWKIVQASDFAQDNVGKYKVVKDVPAASIGTPINDRQQPDVKVVERATKRTLTSVKLQRQPTTVGTHTYYRTVFPSQDTKRIKTETVEVEKTVLVKKEAKPVPKPAKKKDTTKDKGKENKSETNRKESDSKKGGNQTTDKKPVR